MKKGIITLLLAFVISTVIFSQEKPVTFTVEVSTDSILFGNYFEVKFTLENADGQNFEAPDFSEDFNVVSGPNFSTSMSIMNGEMTQNMAITYFLEPKDIGAYYIAPASVATAGEVLETSPLEVLVVPNPDGIKQSPQRQPNNMFQFDWGSDPFENFQFDFPVPPPPSELPPATEREAQPKKKKLKTKRI